MRIQLKCHLLNNKCITSGKMSWMYIPICHLRAFFRYLCYYPNLDIWNPGVILDLLWAIFIRPPTFDTKTFCQLRFYTLEERLPFHAAELTLNCLMWITDGRVTDRHFEFVFAQKSVMNVKQNLVILNISYWCNQVRYINSQETLFKKSTSI